MTTTPTPEAVEALELAMHNAEAWHADTQYKAGSKDVAEVCIELLNKAGFTITRAAQMSDAELFDAFAAVLPEIISQKAGVARLCEIAKKYRGTL